MNQTTQTVLSFIALMADIRAIFRDVHIFAEKRAAFSRVTAAIDPFRTRAVGEAIQPDYADLGVTLTFSLDAELAAPADTEHSSFGLQLLLRHCDGRWLGEGEIGWSGASVGWDAIEDDALQSETFEDLFNDLPAFTRRLAEKYVAFVKEGVNAASRVEH